MSRLVVVSLAALVAVAALTLHDPSDDEHAPPAATGTAGASAASGPAPAVWTSPVVVAAFAAGVAFAVALSWLVPTARRRRATPSPEGSTHAGTAQSRTASDDPDGEWQMLDGDASDLVSLHDAVGFVRYASAPLLELTGFSRHEMVGHHGHDFVHDDDLPTLLAAVHAARADEQSEPALLRLRDKHGRYVWIEAQFRHSVSRTGEPEVLCVARSVARSALPQVDVPVDVPVVHPVTDPVPAAVAAPRWGRVATRAPAQPRTPAPPDADSRRLRDAVLVPPHPLDAWHGPSLQDLCHAFERREFELHYQLKVALADGEVTGAEALLRWNAPEGSGRTAEIIASAERTGFIVTLGEWVVRAAAHQSLQWRHAGLRFPVAVNVSAVQLKDGSFATLMRELVTRDRELPAWLELEVNEHALSGDSDRVMETIARLVALGFTLHVDDFGVGYSKLAQLSRMPVRALKMDRSIVRDLGGTAGAVETVDAVVSLSRALHLKVIAKGVETAEQLELLRAHGCDEVQGYLFSQPMPSDAVRALILPTAAGPHGSAERTFFRRPAPCDAAPSSAR